MFQRAPVTMGRHLELSTCSILISVRAGDLQNGQAFSIIDRRKNLHSRNPFLMEGLLHFRREHNTFYLAFFWPDRYDISCVSRTTRHLTVYVDQTDCLPKVSQIGVWGCVLSWCTPICLWIVPFRFFLPLPGDIITLQKPDWVCTCNPITVHTVPYMKCLHQSRHSSWIAWHLNFVPISCTETSLCNYKPIPRNI